jgi:hypothetical protein
MAVQYVTSAGSVLWTSRAVPRRKPLTAPSQTLKVLKADDDDDDDGDDTAGNPPVIVMKLDDRPVGVG